MALTSTTLNGAVTATATQLRLTSGTGVTNGMYAQIDSEFVLITDISLSPTFQVVRGKLGTGAAAHGTLTPVVFGVAADFVQSLTAGSTVGQPVWPVVSYGAAGAIAVPSVNTIVRLKSGTTSAMTLNDPAKDNEAIVIIQASDAEAYTVDNGSTNNTSGSGFNGGGTTTDVGTFGGAIGDGMVIRANNGTWLVVTKTNITLA
jgi:hypothetical protein